MLKIKDINYNKLKSENLVARLKSADLANKTDFNKKLTRFKNYLK